MKYSVLTRFLIAASIALIVWMSVPVVHAECIPDGYCYYKEDSIHKVGEAGCSGVCNARQGDICETCQREITGQAHCDQIVACDGPIQCSTGYTAVGTCAGGGGGNTPTNTPAPGAHVALVSLC